MNVAILILAVVLVLLFACRFTYRQKISFFTIKDVLLTPEQLENHAMEIAQSHSVSGRKRSARLLGARLGNSFQTISSIYKRLNEDARKGESMSPASEWLLDNFYKIEEQAKRIRRDLIKDRFLKLSILDNGPFAGYPRAYAIALEMVSHTDGRVDEGLLVKFVRTYQSETVLSIAEIWSLPLMTGIALIENIRGICEKIYDTQYQYRKAEKTAQKEQSEMLEEILKNLENTGRINTGYIEHLLGILRKKGVDTGEITHLIDEELEAYDTDVRKVIIREHEEQAALKVSIGNAITSLNIISVLDWSSIFETLSVVDDILMDDPAKVYARMDYESRDYYRRQIELISKKCRTSEISIAKKAVELGEEAAKNGCDEKLQHVGYYITDRGRKKLFEEYGLKGFTRHFHDYNVLVYLVPILLISVAVSAGLIWYAYDVAVKYGILLAVMTGIAVVVPASDIAVAIVNWIYTHAVRPAFLPKLEYKQGIPEDASTLVAITALLPGEKRVKELIERLEIYYLSNREENLYFALVGDFKDAVHKELPGDRDIIKAAREGINRLNRTYAGDKDIFFFLHRHRQYCEEQDNWMGWERKRGALVELNQLIAGAEDTSYSITAGDVTRLKAVRYVITLDADTKLPMDTAKKLIGCITHPLNRASISDGENIVREGYGLIQPRINVDVESANRSLFTRIFTDQGGIDPYTTAFSDIYQDLFSEGIFTGKGIYDIYVFNKVLKDAIPDNTVLSHDLLEGSYLRTGLATDLNLIDDYPSRYHSYITRQHRWTRGDWQIIRWLLSKVKNRKGEYVDNPLSLLSKWKILDNMRRSLASISTVLLLILGLTVLPGNPLVWVFFAVLTVLFPLITGILDYIILKYYKTVREKLHGDLITGLKSTLYQAVLMFVFLPHHAYIMADAIIRTLYRVLVSRRNLLEWVTAADVEKKLKSDRAGFVRRMRPAIYIAVAMIVLVLIIRPANWKYAVALGTVWVFSPIIAYRISRDEDRRVARLPEEDIRELRRFARKTWAYYEDFAGPENNYLPPDNFQVNPANGVAHRTSPTNIGFFLISMLGARDFGYLSTTQMIEKVEKTISTVEKMDTWKGHLFNWYNTKTLEPLRPYYVSTVDSGNMVGYLITLEEGLKEYLERPLFGRELVEGLRDTAWLVGERGRPNALYLETVLENKEFALKEFVDVINTLSITHYEVSAWAGKLHRLLNCIRSEMEKLLPPLEMIFDPPQFINELDIYGKIREQTERLKGPVSIMELGEIYRNVIKEIDSISEVILARAKERDYLLKFKEYLTVNSNNVNRIIEDFNNLIYRINLLAGNTEFVPLFDEKRQLFSIGYNVEEEKLTNSYYDMLASEARLASYIAIARREVPQKHWFKLGRALSLVDGYRGLVSWAGTMFEYMMPTLVMKNYFNTLLDETYATAIWTQKRYGQKRGVPWGTSESGFYAFDRLLNYQYKAFGVPDLGLKRGLIKDMVVSPYSTFLALPFAPVEAMENLKILVSEGMEGDYGFFEAIDYTPDRILYGDGKAIVESYMAHHQGMSFISLSNYLFNNIMQERFHSNPVMRSAEILLQEKVPLRVIITKQFKEQVERLDVRKQENVELIRSYGVPEGPIPRCHFLSNGRYSVMITDGGSGYSKKEHLQITRWREDALSEKYGTFIFLRDLKTNKVWSSTYEPIKVEPDGYKVTFRHDRAEFTRTDHNITTHTEIVVSPEDDVEIRRVTLTNHGNDTASIELTSYFETVLASHRSDIVHPAFNNLFVRTEAFPGYDSLIASRRPREQGQKTEWAVHTVTAEGETIGSTEYESSRHNFIGRGRNIFNPAALSQPLTNTTGIVIDPVMSLRKKVKLEPGRAVRVSFMTGVGGTRDDVVKLAKKYHDGSAVDRAFEIALERSKVEAAYLNLKAKEIEIYQDMVSPIIYHSPLRRRNEKFLKKNRKGQPALWAYGISGDLPVVLVTIKTVDDIDIVRDALKAHEYWRTKGLEVDLVILNEDESSYLQPLRDLIREVVAASYGRDKQGKPGGIHILNTNTMHGDDRVLLYTVARVVLKGGAGPVSSQILPQDSREDLLPPQIPLRRKEYKCTGEEQPSDLHYYNGYGGFSRDGKEYVIRLKDYSNTPAPWINVISNEKFGFQVSESGSGFTWGENSRENKLTPWSNDPVSDPPGEIIYLRDEDTGHVWTITPLPVREKGSYTIRHGAGYSVFRHSSSGIDGRLTLFVSREDPVKISLVELRNTSNTRRRISMTYYIRPVLGVNGEITQQYISTGWEQNTGTILVENSYNSDFPGRTAFVTSSETIESYTGDRREFIGRGRDVGGPAALERVSLSGRTGWGYDPCAALRVVVELEPGGKKEMVFLLGQTETRDQAVEIVTRYKDVPTCKAALDEVKGYWDRVLGTIQVRTPDLSIDLMVNRWFLYQTIACRLWARSAFYQSGGAFGFRDQLQDVVNTIYALPGAARDQIILHSAHQYVEGDVQHWWHPGPEEKGIRTRFSDDLLWLPYAVAEYVTRTDDYSLLHQEVPYLEGEPLAEGEDEKYGTASVSDEKATVYEHCIRAIERSLKFGEHGIPLMGSGDWNDGMNTVGNKGRGESIWLGWFIYTILHKFVPICRNMDDAERSERYIRTAGEIAEALEEKGWDGSWYRRAYFDDGTPLGSAENSECIIDSLAQSWSVISDAAREDRKKEAMKSVEHYLVRRDTGLILLFTPPFDNSDLEPGYIKGYVPGVRENGGQYTHAAAWVIKAFALMGDGDKAWELFNLINPVNHARTPIECATYKVEPYVAAADVYAVSPHEGRGGWTWYTGAAGWLYRVAVEYILGMKRKGERLKIDPCIPGDWREYSVSYRYKDTDYHITVKNPEGVNRNVKQVMVDGRIMEDKLIDLVNDGTDHGVEVILG